jgi:hypothetical protein
MDVPFERNDCMSRSARNRSVIFRATCGGLLAFGAAVFGSRNQASATGINDYQLAGSFTLPSDIYGDGNPVLFNAMPNGKLVTLNENQVSVETGVGTGVFNVSGTLPAAFSPNYGPTFLTFVPGGYKAAAGDGNGDIAVFNASNPSAATVFNLSALLHGTTDSDAKWFNNTLLAISDSNGVDILNTKTDTLTTVLDNIGGAPGGIAFDSAGNLYTGDGYDETIGRADQTGLIKEFSAAGWQSALANNTPLDFEADGTNIAQLLSADSLGFDSSGNFYVGGADSFGSTGAYGYDAIVSASAIQSAIASPASTPPINGSSPSSVINEFTDPYDGQYTPGYWDYNNDTGNLYLSYYGESQVQVVSPVPEPASLALLGLGGAALLMRRRRKALLGIAVLAGLLTAAIPRSANAQGYVFNPNSFATSVVSSTLSGNNPYFNPNGLLGQPCLTFNNSANPNVQQSEMAKIVEPPVNYNLNGGPVLTEIPNSPAINEVTVQMGTPITHSVSHPYGDDLIVFGNSFFLNSSGAVTDATNLNTLTLTGTIYSHPVQVSVSPDDVHWFSFPVTTSLQPYNAYQWDDATASWTTNELNPTVPLNPAIYSESFAGDTASQVLDAYGESAGGTAFDLLNAVDSSGNTLAEDGYSSIDYVRVASTTAGYAVVTGISIVGSTTPQAEAVGFPEPAKGTAAMVASLSLLLRAR